MAKNILKRYIVWLRRMSHSRGFGVQSPSAYRFIRYVLCEHYPYYGYDELRHKHPSLPWLVRKRMELYFRIANYRQASCMLSNGTDTPLLASYVGRACQRTRVDDRQDADIDTVEIARVCAVDGCEAYVEHLLSHTDSHTILIVEDIAQNPMAQRIWQGLLHNPKVSVCYDLYWAGVAFFDTDRFKTCYIVNF